MHVAALQYDIAWEDKPANHARLDALLDAAALPAGTLVVLPEMTDTGFSFDLAAIDENRTPATVPWAQTAAQRLGLWLQVGYAHRGDAPRGRNRTAIVSPAGEVGVVYEKMHPFSFGGEPKHYEGGETLARTTAALGSEPARETVIAPLICYDLRFPEAFRALVASEPRAEIFTLGANWPRTRQHHWRALLIARAIENLAVVIGSNRVGRDEHGLEYTGGSIIVGPQGDVLAEAGDEETVISAEIDLDELRQWRNAFPALQDIRLGGLGDLPVQDVDTAPRKDLTT